MSIATSCAFRARRRRITVSSGTARTVSLPALKPGPLTGSALGTVAMIQVSNFGTVHSAFRARNASSIYTNRRQNTSVWIQASAPKGAGNSSRRAKTSYVWNRALYLFHWKVRSRVTKASSSSVRPAKKAMEVSSGMGNSVRSCVHTTFIQLLALRKFA